MAIKKSHQGFALLVAVIFMTVMLSFGMMLSSLAYKQTILASSATDSQYAFYAADGALECVLLLDQDTSGSKYAYPASDPLGTPPINCGENPAGVNPAKNASYIYSNTAALKRWVVTNYFDLDWVNGSPTHCARTDVYKYKDPQGTQNITTYVFSQGYSVPCDQIGSSNRAASRGLQAHY